jgi:hypothetical protein
MFKVGGGVSSISTGIASYNTAVPRLGVLKNLRRTLGVVHHSSDKFVLSICATLVPNISAICLNV